MPTWWVLFLGCRGDHEVDGIGAYDDTELIEIPLAGCYYYRTADVAIGGQHFQLLIDSGSTTLAVSADPCPSCVDDGVEKLYDTTHGTDMGQSAATRYDQGEIGWSGSVYFDTVSMGGIEPVGMRFVAVSDQDFMFGTHVCNGDALAVDGILGLRQDAALAPGTDSYLTSAVRSAGVDDSFAIRALRLINSAFEVLAFGAYVWVWMRSLPLSQNHDSIFRPQETIHLHPVRN